MFVLALRKGLSKQFILSYHKRLYLRLRSITFEFYASRPFPNKSLPAHHLVRLLLVGRAPLFVTRRLHVVLPVMPPPYRNNNVVPLLKLTFWPFSPVRRLVRPLVGVKGYAAVQAVRQPVWPAVWLFVARIGQPAVTPRPFADQPAQLGFPLVGRTPPWLTARRLMTAVAPLFPFKVLSLPVYDKTAKFIFSSSFQSSLTPNSRCFYRHLYGQSFRRGVDYSFFCPFRTTVFRCHRFCDETLSSRH